MKSLVHRREGLHISALAGTALMLALGYSVIASEDAASSTEPKNSGRSVWTQNVTQFRKEHGIEGGYTKRWDRLAPSCQRCAIGSLRSSSSRNANQKWAGPGLCGTVTEGRAFTIDPKRFGSVVTVSTRNAFQPNCSSCCFAA